MSIDAKSINIHMQVTGPFAGQMAANGAAVQTFGNQANAGMAKAQTGMAKFGVVAGKVAQGAGIGLAVALALSAKAAISFESSFAGVRKTVEATEPEFQALALGIRNLAKEIPIATKELNEIAELGGQLGVGKGGLIEFTETIAALGVTTTLTTEQAATGFARIDNVMKLGQLSFSNMGSAIVDLGNNFAATEDEILTFATRIAPIGATLGFATDEIFAIATAFTSVGVPAERGGTAIQKTLIKIAEAASIGGEDLKTFAKVAGTTVEEFQQLVKVDPALAFQKFVSGLGTLESQGMNTFAVLDSLSLSNQRVISSLLAMANAEGVLVDALNMGEQAWRDDTALMNEAEKRYETFASKAIIAKNKVVDFGITIGNDVLPYLSDFVTGLSTITEFIANMDPVLRRVGMVVVGFAATLTLALTKHPAILALGLIAAAIWKIGNNAAEAERRVKLLKEVMEHGFEIELDAANLIGQKNLDVLLAGGFKLVDIEQAITGTKEDMDRFVTEATAYWEATASGTDKELFSNKFMEGFPFGSSASETFDEINTGPVITALDAVAGAHEDYGKVVEDVAAKEKEIADLRAQGLPYPGQAREVELQKRRELSAAIRLQEQMERQFGDKGANLKPAYLEGVFDLADRLETEYVQSIQDSFAETMQARQDEIDGWYDFGKDIDIAFGDILATVQRQIAAGLAFEDLLYELDLAPAVEAAYRKAFASPALKEAYVKAVREGGKIFIEGVGNITLAEFDELMTNTFADALPKWAAQWARDILPKVEDVGMKEWMASFLEEGRKAIEDDEGAHGSPAQLWLGFMKAALDSAGTESMRQSILDIFNETFGDPGANGLLDITAGKLQIILDLLNNLPDSKEIGVTIFYDEVGRPYFPSGLSGADRNLLNKGKGTYLSGSDRNLLKYADSNAFGGGVEKNKPTWVGEYERELFVPYASGRIIPESKLNNGDTSYVLNIHGSKDVADDGRVALLTAQTLGSM